MVTVLNLENCTHTIMDFPKKRSAFAPKEQDPMSHRIIEKRRRDRMNNCLADLSRLIPPDYLKKGRGRIEKTEIIEMAIKHLKYLQERASLAERRVNGPISAEHFRLGYQECLSEVMRYLVEGQAHFPGDTICVQLINHLQRHCDNIMKGDVLNKPRFNPDSNSSSSGTSSNYMFHNQLPAANNNPRITRKSSDNSNEEKSRLSYDIEQSRRTSECIDDSLKENSNEEQDYDNQNMSPESLGNGNGYSPPEDNADEGGGWNRTEILKKSMHEISENPKSDNQSKQDLRMYNHFPVLPPSYHYGSHHLNCNAQKPVDDSGLSLSSGQEIDNMHSYKFKNTIKQRFSQSQSTDYLSSSHSDGTINMYNRHENLIAKREQFNSNGKMNHKKRKIESRHFTNSYNKQQYMDQMSSSETNSSENVTSHTQNPTYRSNMLPEVNIANRQSIEKDYSKHTMMNNRHEKTYNTNEKVESYTNASGLGVPIFALHAKGTFYVPMNVDYDCLTPFLGQYDLLETTTLQSNSSLHPVTISVNFQPKFYSNKQPMIRSKIEFSEWH